MASELIRKCAHIGTEAKLSDIDACDDKATDVFYRWSVPLTDEHGRHLGVLLNYLLDGQVTSQQIYLALGMSSSGYYRRIKQDDFPNADELHKIARSFRLSLIDLQVRLGFVTREDLEGYIGSLGVSVNPAGRRSEARALASG